jgi:formate dehydrogenase iron-sulfur subunit
VACKEWNGVPESGLEFLGLSYDNTGSLGADTWRHVAFIEQSSPIRRHDADAGGSPTGSLGVDTPPESDGDAGFFGDAGDFRWLMSSDVCKHCTSAACLDVCPTGSLFRTEFGTVVVQEDICNGCGYCVPACPFGVIDRRRGEKGVTKNAGLAQKCTLCYDRLGEGMEPACAKACPTQSIQFGDLDLLRERATERVADLQRAGVDGARLYGHDPNDGIGGAGAFFLLLDEPEVYGLPPDPVVTTRALPAMWRGAAFAAGSLILGAVVAFIGSSS